MSAREQGQEMEMFMALGEEPQDNEAVKEAGTGHLVPPAGTRAWVGRTDSWTPPGGTGTVQTAQDWGCS